MVQHEFAYLQGCVDDFVRSTVTPKLGNILTSSQLFVLGIKVYALAV